jgi:hypothetical protein
MEPHPAIGLVAFSSKVNLDQAIVKAREAAFPITVLSFLEFHQLVLTDGSLTTGSSTTGNMFDVLQTDSENDDSGEEEEEKEEEDEKEEKDEKDKFETVTSDRRYARVMRHIGIARMNRKRCNHREFCKYGRSCDFDHTRDEMQLFATKTGGGSPYILFKTTACDKIACDTDHSRCEFLHPPEEIALCVHCLGPKTDFCCTGWRHDRPIISRSDDLYNKLINGGYLRDTGSCNLKSFLSNFNKNK